MFEPTTVFAERFSVFWPKRVGYSSKAWKNFKKVNFAHFVSFCLGENLLKDMFWTKRFMSKLHRALKQLQKVNFVHFMSCALGVNPLRNIFWTKRGNQSCRAWLWSNLRKWKCCSFWLFVNFSLHETPLKDRFWSKRGGEVQSSKTWKSSKK